MDVSRWTLMLSAGVAALIVAAFWEPMKFATKARYLTTGAAPIMSLIHPTAGHGGPPGADGQRNQQALFVAFAIAAENPDRFWRRA